LREKVALQGRMRGVDATFPNPGLNLGRSPSFLAPLIRLAPQATFSLKGRRKRVTNFLPRPRIVSNRLTVFKA